MKQITFFKLFLFLGVVSISCRTSFAQNITFLKSSHDFGQVANGLFQPAVFEFVNTGSSKVAIMMAKSVYEVKSKYERAYVQPGDTGRVEVTIETQRLGAFKENVDVLFAHSPKPFKLQITGEIIDVLECFPDKNNRSVREIRIVDAQTKQIIRPSYADFSLNFGAPISVRTSKVGKTTAQIPIGPYGIRAWADGYNVLTMERYIRKSEPILFLELQRASQPIAQPTPVAEPEEVVEPEPVVQTSDSTLPEELYRDNNIVFLIDISLSMKKNGKMDKVKNAMDDLVKALRPIDRISIITYNNKATTLVNGKRGSDKVPLYAAVDSLKPRGLTNGVAGLQSAYQLAYARVSKTGNNQVILITDGEFTGSQSGKELEKIVTYYAEQSIIMSILSFGEDKEAVSGLQKMAKRGGGNYLQYGSLQTSKILLKEIQKQSLKE